MRRLIRCFTPLPSFVLLQVLPLILSPCNLSSFFFFFFNDTATTEIYTLSLHDALPISLAAMESALRSKLIEQQFSLFDSAALCATVPHDSGKVWTGLTAVVRNGGAQGGRSEEHTSELQSLRHLVCRLLLEKKKKKKQSVDKHVVNHLELDWEHDLRIRAQSSHHATDMWAVLDFECSVVSCYSECSSTYLA